MITWPLWLVHDTPPMLPALPLPTVDCGAWLLGSLVLIVFAPVWGVVLHMICLIYAMVIDQIRMQPEIVSLAFLLWGTLPSRNAKAIARSHLVSLWLFAGLNKLLSPGFIGYGSRGFVALLMPEPPLWLCVFMSFCLAFAELGTGLLALSQRSRKFTGLAAFGLHIGILLALSPVGRGMNVAVWPWNWALALSGFALSVPWQSAVSLDLRACHLVVRVAAVFIFLSPLGFYLRLTDAYLAHNLYSSNAPIIKILGKAPHTARIRNKFKVPFPPVPRLYKQYFQLTCHPGDIMIIRYPLWWRLSYGEHSQELTCDLTGAGDI